MIPETLYRGDADKNNSRQLKLHLKKRLLLTNLISGGNGNIIFSKPLIELVKEHISPGWGKTHFLSFSELKGRAFEFGEYEFKGERCQYFEEDNNWDFALLTFKTSHIINCDLLEAGVYKCNYEASFIEFSDGYKFLFVNTAEYLKANKNLNTNSQIEKAEGDKEWLILPTNSILLNNNRIEYSAKIDMGKSINYELYKMI